VRRFELVQGTSAKFWAADVDGATFVVLYGRLGTAGQRKDKAFPSEEAARKELDKKISEKLREGYSEVQVEDAAGAGGAAAGGAAGEGTAAADPGAKPKRGAAAASRKLDLPPRFAASAAPPPAAAIAGAAAAVRSLATTVGKRSFVVAHAARRARRALEAVHGVDPAEHAELQAALDSVWMHVAADRARLPLGLAMDLLDELPTATFERALGLWAEGRKPPAAVALLAAENEVLGDAELAFRFGTLLVDRAGRSATSAAGWERRFKALLPHLQAQLVRNGTTPRKHLAAIDAKGDPFVAARVAQAMRLG